MAENGPDSQGVDAAGTHSGAAGRRTRLRPEWVFVSLGLSLGLAFLFLTPPLQVPDEEAHLRRSYQLSEGKVVSVRRGEKSGDTLPAAVAGLGDRFDRLWFHPEEKTTYAEIRDAQDIVLEPAQREFLVFSNTAIHSPLPYLPQALGIFVARQLSSSVLVCFYAGRLLNLLTALAVTFLAIRRSPVCKWSLTALALTPMSVFLMASLSSDALTNAVAFLFVAQVLRCTFGSDRPLGRRDLLVLVGLGVCLGLVKQAYFLLPCSFLMVPASRLGSRARCWGSRALVLGSALVAAAAWSVVVRDVYASADPGRNIDPVGQLRQMWADPAEFLGVLMTTIGSTYGFFQQYLGVLGWLDTPLPEPLLLVEAALLLVVGLADSDRRVRWPHALVALGTALLVAGCVLVIIHVTWDPIGYKIIMIQGRYFIPVGPLVGLALSWLGSRLAVTRASGAAALVVTAAIPCVLGVSLYFLVDRYYIDNEEAAAVRASRRATDVDSIIEERDPDTALKILRTFVRFNPHDTRLLTRLADLLAATDHFDEAIATYERAIEQAPKYAPAREGLERVKARREESRQRRGGAR